MVTMYEQDSPLGLSNVLHCHKAFCGLSVNSLERPKWPGARGCQLEGKVASGSPLEVSPPRG